MTVAEDAPTEWTTLRICNALLRAVGYRSLYVDANGAYRSEPYVAPSDLPQRWAYSADSATTTVSEARTSLSDYFDAANVIVGVNDDPEAATVPVDGDGIYRLENQSDGPTSIDARGRRIVRVFRTSVANQAALVTAVEEIANNEKRITEMIEISVSPNPIHGHFDVVNYRDDDLAVNARYLVQSWTLPLDGSDMALILRGQ